MADSPTPSILATLGRSPFDASAKPLTWPEVSRHLREQYLFNDAERARKERAAERQRLFQCRGEDLVSDMIDKVLKDDDVKQKRREWIEYAKFNNVLRRVIGELSTVYAQPARRTVAGAENNRRYQEVQRVCRQHEVMMRVNRLLNLHRALYVMPRMRTLPSGATEPVIDVVVPSNFHAVRDPMDPTLNIGVIFETDYALPHATSLGKRVPKWILWTWAESVMIDSAGEVLVDTLTPHDYGEMPALLMTLEPPDGKLIDSDTGDDLIAAHKSVWLLNVFHLKEAKSATRQPVLQGDLSQTMRGQADDSEVPLELPEGATASVLDRSMDLSMFTASAQHVFDTSAANHGLAPSLLHHQGVQSADARELMRVPLRELRLMQQVPLRDFERTLARLLSRTVRNHPELSFTDDGWAIDFADPQTPLGTHDALVVLEKELQLGLTSEVAEILRRNSDLTPAQAEQVLNQFIDDRTRRLQRMREFMTAAGGMAQGAVPKEAGARQPGNSDDDFSWVQEVVNAT